MRDQLYGTSHRGTTNPEHVPLNAGENKSKEMKTIKIHYHSVHTTQTSAVSGWRWFSPVSSEKVVCPRLNTDRRIHRAVWKELYVKKKKNTKCQHITWHQRISLKMVLEKKWHEKMSNFKGNVGHCIKLATQLLPWRLHYDRLDTIIYSDIFICIIFFLCFIY